MDFSWTDEQQMLRDSVSRLLQARYDFETRQAIVKSDQPWSPQVWTALSELGVLALPFAEDKGGFGGSISDIAAITEHFGEHLLVEPFLSSILLAGQFLARSANPAAGDHLTDLTTGEKTAAFGHEEGSGTANPAMVMMSARQNGDGFTLEGEKRMVLGGADASLLVVTARTSGNGVDKEGVALFMIEPQEPGITMTSFKTIDGRSAAHMRFQNVSIPSENLLEADAYNILNEVISQATIALCAEAVGAMGELLRMTSEYASIRKQFGVAIGTFQAIAHRLADMRIAHTKARATLIYTVALAEAGQAGAREISILKAQIGKLGQAVGEAAIQTHGGVGMTDELSVGHFHKRLLAINALFGDREYHFRRVGESLTPAGPAR